VTKNELELLNRFSLKYNIECEPTNGKFGSWDFTYKWKGKKYYCEMKKRSFTLELAKNKYSEGLILEMHKYERILRKTKNEKSSQGLYFNFFDCDSVLIFNLNKIKISNWVWRTLPETSNFSRRKFVYKYITFLDYDKAEILYI